MANSETKVTKRPILNVQPPKDYKVIYLNDDVTTFDYQDTEAFDKAKQINDEGSGVVAVLPFEIAEQKGVEVLVQARQYNYPLEVKLESN